MISLSSLTYPEVELYLKTRTDIIVPVGSTEQHGPHGIMAMDTVCALAVSHELSFLTNILVAPPINLGMAQHHLGFAGSISLRPKTLMAIVSDVVNSLAKHGFTRIIFLNGHGGNIPSYRAAIDEIYFEMSLHPSLLPECLEVSLHNWWDPVEVEEYCANVFGCEDGEHVTASEVSIALFSDSAQKPFPNGSVSPRSTFTHAGDFRSRFSDGQVGSRPSLAQSHHGAELVRLSALGLARALNIGGCDVDIL